MVDIELVIKIPEELYKEQLSRNWTGNIIIHDAIVSGTPLPKGHGDLIDIDKLNLFAKEHEIGNSAYDGELIYDAGETSRHDTIWKPLSDAINVVIKADKAESEVEKEI